jgi:putative hydrolase
MSTPFGFGAGSPFDMNSLGAALQQLGRMLQQGEGDGPIRWNVVRDVARQAISAGGDPVVPDAQVRAVHDAFRLADVWLDGVTTFPASDGPVQAWSRSEWVTQTLPAWERIVAPIGEQMQGAVSSALPALNADPQAILQSLPENIRQMLPDGIPPEMAQMIAPMMGMMQQLGSAAFSMQLGQSLAGLASEVLSSSDIGIPLTLESVRALLPGNITTFGEGLGLPQSDVLVFIALRESAHHRLFDHVPWLRARVIGAVEEYARYMQVNTASLTSALDDIDISNPQALQEIMSRGIVEPEPTDEQRAAVARLETLLALVEGWVDDVVTQAIEDRLPSAPSLREAIQRRRAVGGPSEKTFATLVGMQLRPRAMREAATVFAAMRSMKGVDVRDALWGHPDLLPSTEDLEDPLGFVQATDDTQP